jgi:hypothetical protein
MDPFQIPDYLSPIIAYRTWHLDTDGLKSLNMDLWLPGEAKKAACRRSGVVPIYPVNANANALLPSVVWNNAKGEWEEETPHEAPVDGCTCGVYAAKNLAHLANIGYLGQGVHGEVYLWGRVWDHRLGYRAQYAYPKNIIIPQDMLPYQLADIEKRLLFLTAYNIDLSLSVPGMEDLPLWLKATGTYEPQAIDWLLNKRKKWYEHHMKDAALKVGDRVSVLGVGIGLIVAVRDESPSIISTVCIRMFNTELLTVPRDGVVWSDRNFRWETEGKGYVTQSLTK